MSSDAEAAVVDASVAVKWHLTDEEDADKAADLLAQFVRGQIVLVAPDQIRYEVPSAIAAATLGRRPRLTPGQGRDAVEEFLALGVRTIGDQELILAAYSLVHQYGCAFYDALYLALAQRLQLSLVTADRKLYQRVGYLPEVVWVGDYGRVTTD